MIYIIIGLTSVLIYIVKNLVIRRIWVFIIIHKLDKIHLTHAHVKMIRSSKLLLWMVLKIPSSTQNHPPGGALEFVIDTMEFSVTQKNIAII